MRRERERERDRKREIETERQGERETERDREGQREKAMQPASHIHQVPVRSGSNRAKTLAMRLERSREHVKEESNSSSGSSGLSNSCLPQLIKV